MINLDVAASGTKFTNFFNPNAKYSSMFQLGKDYYEQQLYRLICEKPIHLFTSTSNANISLYQHFKDKNILYSENLHKTSKDFLSKYGKKLCMHKGKLDLDYLSLICSINKNSLITIELVNGETGIITGDIWEISKICKENKCELHLDITQAVTSNITFEYELADYLTFNSSKSGAFKGVGYLMGDIHLNENIGTYPIEIVGQTVEGLKQLRKDYNKLCKVAHNFISRLSHGIDIRENLKDEYDVNSVPNIVPIYYPNLDVDLLYIELLKREVLCGRGSACSQGHDSYAYQNLGYDAKKVIRYSFDSSLDVDMAVKIINECTSKLT